MPCWPSARAASASRAAAWRRASPTPSAAPRAGCAWTTCATRRATSSSSRACWPTPTWSTARRWGSPAARTAAAYRSTSRSCATGSCGPTAACSRGPHPTGSRCGSPAPSPGSRGATSPTRWPPTDARSTTRSRRRPPTSSPSGSPSSPSSPASTRRARPAATTPRRAPTPTPISRPGSPRSTPASPMAPRNAPSPTSSPRITPPTTSTTRAPAPTLIANGWTDDLFPVDEALRFYNRTRAQYPNAPLALMFLDFGHQRGQNKDADVARFEQRAYAWMDRYVKGDASAPALQGVEALTQTCPKIAPSDGPYDAPTWKALHPGEVRFASAAAQTVLSAGGAPAVARAFDPIAGDGACATTSAADEPGTASYRLPAATGDGYTLLGAPTVIADLKLTGTFPELAARLLDVAPDGTQTLVARGLYRPTADGRQAFQLHPGAWRFAAGHVARLELLGRDAPYARASNGTFAVGVGSLELRLPVRERRGAEVRRPLAPVPGR